MRLTRAKRPLRPWIEAPENATEGSGQWPDRGGSSEMVVIFAVMKYF